MDYSAILQDILQELKKINERAEKKALDNKGYKDVRKKVRDDYIADLYHKNCLKHNCLRDDFAKFSDITFNYLYVAKYEKNFEKAKRIYQKAKTILLKNYSKQAKDMIEKMRAYIENWS